MKDAGRMPYMEALGFHLVGYGCTACIGNSGPLPEHIAQAIQDGDLAAAARRDNSHAPMHSRGPRNCDCPTAPPPLVIAYALAGNLNIDLTRDPLGTDPNGQYVYLKDIWPRGEEINDLIETHVTAAQFKRHYADVFAGDEQWRTLPAPTSELYQWRKDSTYIKEPPFFTDMGRQPPLFTDIK